MVISFVLLDSGQYWIMGESSPWSDHDRLYWIILSILTFLAHCNGYGVTASRVPEKTRILGNGSSKSVSRRRFFFFPSTFIRPTKASTFPERRLSLPEPCLTRSTRGGSQRSIILMTLKGSMMPIMAALLQLLKPFFMWAVFGSFSRPFQPLHVARVTSLRLGKATLSRRLRSC